MGCGSSKQDVDLLVKNAVIYTVDSVMSVCDAMAVDKGKIVAIGSWDEIQKSYQSEQIIDLVGNFVYPGFIDPHCHFWGYGMWSQKAALNGSRSYEEMIARLNRHDSLYNPDWIVGRGWDQNLWPGKQLPDNQLLNMAFPDKPVVLIRIDGHAALVNKKALELSGFLGCAFDRGEVVWENGENTGLLLENAADFMKAAIPKLSIEEKMHALKRAEYDCANVGLTTLGDAGSDAEWIKLFNRMHRMGMLKISLYVMLNPTEKNVQWYEKTTYDNSRLHIKSIKLYADGALGSRGACLLQPYSDAPETFGIMSANENYLRAWCRIAKEKGLQVCTHAIGDSAVRTVLKIYKEFLTPGNDLRWRIEHAQVVHPDDFADFGTYGIIPSIQTTHATSDMYWAIERLGEDRIRHAYAYRDLLNQNGWLPNGSDFPIEDINPLYGFYSAITRRDHDGKPDEGFLPEQALSREEALKAMTIWAAKSMFMEKSIGSLEAGKDADFVVLPTDILSCNPAEIIKMKPIMCYKAGKLISAGAL